MRCIMGMLNLRTPTHTRTRPRAPHQALSLIIASVPVALPMVMQITLAIGARKMADHKAIVTHLTALQEIASMTVLCSDKTGTLTTANITVMHDQIWVMDGFSAEECLIWGAAASNRANLDDAIDSAVFRAMKSKYVTVPGEPFPSMLLTLSVRSVFDTLCVQYRFGDDWERQLDDYQITKFNGFNPEYKRTSSYINYRKGGKTQSLRIGKGLVDKVLSTGNDGGDMWRVENFAEVRSTHTRSVHCRRPPSAVHHIVVGVVAVGHTDPRAREANRRGDVPEGVQNHWRCHQHR